MFDWSEIERSRRASVESANRAPLGLPKEQLVPGALVTISPCKCTGDRSYSHDIWEIRSSNEGHLSITKHKPAAEGSLGAHFNGPHLVCVHEHEFYGADHLKS